MKLRPHHLLCTQSFTGKGYNNIFVENMTKITDELRNSPTVEIEVVYYTDDICVCCPHKIGENVCDQNEKVRVMDEKIVNYFDVKQARYNYKNLIDKINAALTLEIIDDICGKCSWYKISNCYECFKRDNE